MGSKFSDPAKDLVDDVMTHCLLEHKVPVQEILEEHVGDSYGVHHRLARTTNDPCDDGEILMPLIEKDQPACAPTNCDKPPRLAKWFSEYLTAARTVLGRKPHPKSKKGMYAIQSSVIGKKLKAKSKKGTYAQISKSEDEHSSVSCFGRGCCIRKFLSDIIKIEEDFVTVPVPRSILYRA